MSSDGLSATARHGTGDAVPGTGIRCNLILYIAGRGPNSVRAIANLNALVQAYGHECFEVEFVDVLVEPQRALRDHVLVTPTLVKLAPPPSVQIAGDLSDAYRVVYALGLDPTIWDGRED